jgi:hypothetical protein
MRYFRYFVVTAIFLGTVLISCKENIDNPRNFTVSLLDSIIVLQDNIKTIEYGYEYVCQNRVTERKRSSSNGFSDYSLYYNAKGDTIKYTSCYILSRCYRCTFSQYGNKVNIFINYHPSVSIFGTVKGELELNAQGLPLKLTYEDVGVSGSSDYSKYRDYTTVTLTWQNGNLTKTDLETNWEKENVYLNWEDGTIDHIEKEEGSNAATTTYTYDNKKPPFYHCNTPKWALWLLNYYNQDVNYGYNTNNIKTVTSEDGNTIKYEYTYNDDEFPVARTWDEGTIIYTEIYTYKAVETVSNNVCTLENYW